MALVYSTKLVAQLGYHLYFTTMVTESYSSASALLELVTQYGISIARILSAFNNNVLKCGRVLMP